MRKIFLSFCTAAAIVAAAATPAQAGIITAVSSVSLPGFSTGSLGPVGITPNPNNDGGTGINALAYQIFFNAGGLGPAEYQFQVADSGGISEYLVTAMVVNNTGTPWSHYRLELGFGTGNDFVRSSAIDFLDFDTPDRTPAPTSSRFSTLAHGSDLLQWSGGTVPSIGAMFLTFRLDVPDGLAGLHPGGLPRFTLRQQPGTGEVPSVPEPALLTVMGVALLAGAAHRHRR